MIKFDNEQLEKYLLFKLDKQEKSFSKEELAGIEELVLDPVNINGEYNEIDLDIIKYFTHLKRVLFKNLKIPDNAIEKLFTISSLESMYFERCNFENISLLTKLNIKEIEFINCALADYSFLYNMNELKSLSIVNGVVSITGINKLKKLQYLQLSYSTILDIEDIELPNLKELHIDNTNIYDVSIISKIHELERLSISEDQYIENKEYYSNLSKKGVIVLNENMVEFNEECEINE